MRQILLLWVLTGCGDDEPSLPDGGTDVGVPDEGADVRSPDARVFSEEELEAAAVRFRANCSTCHRSAGAESWITGMGTRDLAGVNAAVVALQARVGSPPHMPAFHEDEISDDELAALGAYVESLPEGYREPPPFDVEVAIRDRDPWFFPMQIRIEAGQTIRFRNEGATYHDVSLYDWITSHGAEGFSSGQMGPGGTFTVTFEETGANVVVCKNHPYMRGEIHVGQDFEVPEYAPTVPQPVPSVAGTGEIWVAAQWEDKLDDSGDGVLHVIDASSWLDVAQLPVGNNPHNLWLLGDADRVLATNWFDNTLSIIDAQERMVESEIAVGATAAHVMTNDDDSVVWVSIEGSHYVEGVDPESWWFAQNGRIWVDGNMPHGLAYANGRMLVANSMTDDASLIDVELGEEIALIPTGHYPLGAAVSPDGTRGLVGNCLGETVSVLDLDAAAKIEDIPLEGCVVQIGVTPDGARAVVAHGTKTSIIDIMTVDVLGEFSTGNGAHGVAIGSAEGGGSLAYVTHKYDNHVSVIDVETPAHLGDVPLVVSMPGRTALVGVSDTGGQGIVVRAPN